jgi:hypothetical protein
VIDHLRNAARLLARHPRLDECKQHGPAPARGFARSQQAVGPRFVIRDGGRGINTSAMNRLMLAGVKNWPNAPRYPCDDSTW